MAVRVLRNVDLLLLALALPAFLAAGLPVAGWLTAAVVWGMWRGVGAYTDRRAASTRDPRAVAGWAAGSVVGRGWAMGLILLGVGLLAGDDVGLSAAVLCVVLFSLWFATKLILRPFDRAQHPST